MTAYDVLIVSEMLFHSLGWNLGKVCRGSWKSLHLTSVSSHTELSLLLFDSLIAGNSQTWFPAG